MGDLQALIIVFQGLEGNTGIFMLNIIATVLLCVKTFVFNFPPEPATITDPAGCLPGDPQVGDMDKARRPCPIGFFSGRVGSGKLFLRCSFLAESPASGTRIMNREGVSFPSQRGLPFRGLRI